MKKKRPGVHQHGTPAELAEHVGGFSANGESQFTRRSARTRDIGKSMTRPAKMLATLILKNERTLGTMQGKLNFERAPVEREKIAKQIGIKMAFLDKLKAERRSQTP